MHIYSFIIYLLLLASCLQQGKKTLRENAYIPTEKEKLQASESICNESEGFIFDTDRQECLTAKNWCIFNKSAEGWKWIGEQCVDPKVQCSLKQDGSSFINGECLSLEESCKTKEVQGYLWKDNTCLSPVDVCNSKGYDYSWNEKEKSCKIKDFLTFCQDIEAPQNIQYTINVLATIFDVQGCTELKEELQNINTLELTFNLERYGEKINTLSPLSEFINITEIRAQNNAIENLDALSEMTNLKYLDLSNNKIQSIKGLKKLIKLETLLLGSNNISDLDAIENLENLVSLQVFDNKISDINPLKNLLKLELLHLNGNLISNINELKGLKSLNNFDISYNPISEPGFLKSDNNCPKDNNPEFSEQIISFCQE